MLSLSCKVPITMNLRQMVKPPKNIDPQEVCNVVKYYLKKKKKKSPVEIGQSIKHSVTQN